MFQMFGESSKSPLLMIRWLPLLAAYQIAAMQLSSPSCLRGGSSKQLICSVTINRQLGQKHVVHENFQECSKRQSTTTIARELCRCFPTVFFSHALVDIQRVLQHSNLERRLKHHRLNECNSSIDTRHFPAECRVWYRIEQTTPLETSWWLPLYWAMDCCIPIFFFFSFFFFSFWAFYKMSNSGVHQHLPSKNCMGLKHLALVDGWWWRTVYVSKNSFLLFVRKTDCVQAISSYLGFCFEGKLVNPLARRRRQWSGLEALPTSPPSRCESIHPKVSARNLYNIGRDDQEHQKLDTIVESFLEGRKEFLLLEKTKRLLNALIPSETSASTSPGSKGSRQ